jgi:tRNA (Thr-GGU) A37 N-methylase
MPLYHFKLSLQLEDLPLVGVFSPGSPQRTNPIGLTVVRPLEIKGNILKVDGMDAFDGTPVFDPKPPNYLELVVLPLTSRKVFFRKV